jgi:hypothetical protein
MRQIISPLSGIRSPFGLRNGRFSPAVLFANNEPGVWYDPSQAANLDWRRNLLTYTEQFNNAAWAKARSSVEVDTATSPFGDLSAEKLVEDTTAANSHNINVSQSFTSGTSYTLSVYAKESERPYILLLLPGAAFGSTTFATFNLSTGAIVTSGNSPTTDAVDLGNGWWRVSISKTATATSAGLVEYRIATEAATAGIYTGDGTSGIFIWGAQLEVGSTATEYQRISDVNTEVRERFPEATLFQDTAGTTPVTTPGQTVALMLDKSKGLVLGPELVTNGGPFENTTGWTATNGATLSVVSSKLRITGNGSTTFPKAETTVSTVAGKTYLISVPFVRVSGPGPTVYLNLKNPTGEVTFASSTASSGTFVLRVAAGGSTLGVVVVGQSANDVVDIDNISVKELPGFHATQATTSWCPRYGIVPAGGRRNLLTHTEQFDNASGWANQVQGTGVAPVITANAGVDPLGGMAADRLQFSRSTAISPDRSLRQSTVGNVTFTSGVSYTASFWAKSFSGADQDLHMTVNANGAAAQLFTVTSEWQRFSYTFVSGATIVNSTGPVRLGLFDAVSAALTSDVLIWGAQLEVGSTASAYQRVSTAFDVTEAGVESLGYLSFDGVDDWMVTPTITPGTDKAQVFAGVRKLSDAALGIAVEYSATVDTNNGAFYLAAPVAAGTANYLFRSKGTSGVNASYTNAAVAAPITNVLTGLGDIPGDRATLRVNGTQVAQNTADQGTGNYLAYPMYIGSRAGTSLRFNGHLHQLITRFGDNLELAQIESTEAYVAGKTAGVDL